jgi:predicted nucleotidyltransferase
MLEIFNNLELFFEDCYRRISVREYARLTKISPPTASKLLERYRKIGLLIKEEEKQYFYYFANKKNDLFIDLSRVYWKIKLNKKELIDFLEKELLNPIIILFGSLSKAETKTDSDIDLAIFSPTKKQINVEKFEKLLKRRIQTFIFKEKKDVRNEELLNNILNGYRIRGNW